MFDSLISAYQSLMDAVDVPLFLVDEDIRLIAVNEAAKEVFGFGKEAFHLRRGGEVLHCLHAHDVPEGCGRGPLCGACVIRNSATASLGGVRVSRRRMKLRRRSDNELRDLEVMISARALPDLGPNLTLLTIEDVTEVTHLRNIIPICMMCKKIRDDQEYWQQVETYFCEQIGVDFSHGFCPACEDKYRADNGLRRRR